MSQGDAGRFALETEAVTVDFDGLRALDGVSMQVPVGQRRAVIGPNGAGKTTLFNVIAGQLRPTAGTVRLRGQEVTAMSPSSRARLGLGRTFQRTTLLSSMTVEENVRVAVAAAQPRARRAVWRAATALPALTEPTDRLLDRWDLGEVRDTRVDALSHGRQRIVEIVLALASEPRLLLLDEPTAGLTRREAARMTELVGALPDDITVLVIEHDMDVAFALADVVQVMVDGRVLSLGPPERVRSDGAVVDAYLGASGPDAANGGAQA